MAFLALIIGVAFVVVSIRGTHDTLLKLLGQDVPAFAVWGAALFGVAVIGFIPGLKPISRGLLALLVVVLILTNYKNILASFTGVATGVASGAGNAPAGQTSGGAGVAAHPASAAWDLSSLLGQIGGVDFTDFLGNSNGVTFGDTPAATSSAATTTPQADKAIRQASIRQEDRAAPALFSVPTAAPKLPANSPVTASDPLGTAGARQWQAESFTYEAMQLKASGLDPQSAAYQSKLNYLATLRSGVNGQAAGYADLKAMGL